MLCAVARSTCCCARRSLSPATSYRRRYAVTWRASQGRNSRVTRARGRVRATRSAAERKPSLAVPQAAAAAAFQQLLAPLQRCEHRVTLRQHERAAVRAPRHAGTLAALRASASRSSCPVPGRQQRKWRRRYSPNFWRAWKSGAGPHGRVLPAQQRGRRVGGPKDRGPRVFGATAPRCHVTNTVLYAASGL